MAFPTFLEAHELLNWPMSKRMSVSVLRLSISFRSCQRLVDAVKLALHRTLFMLVRLQVWTRNSVTRGPTIAETTGRFMHVHE